MNDLVGIMCVIAVVRLVFDLSRQRESRSTNLYFPSWRLLGRLHYDGDRSFFFRRKPYGVVNQ